MTVKRFTIPAIHSSDVFDFTHRSAGSRLQAWLLAVALLANSPLIVGGLALIEWFMIAAYFIMLIFAISILHPPLTSFLDARVLDAEDIAWKILSLAIFWIFGWHIVSILSLILLLSEIGIFKFFLSNNLWSANIHEAPRENLSMENKND
jgi:hypothetical protein